MPASLSTKRLADAAAMRMGRRGISRRSFLVRTAVAGSALAVAPKRFLLEPWPAYANIIGVCGTGDEPDCPSLAGYSVFCATVNNGVNKCPGNSVPGGWWRADGSSWCCGGDRYYIDCHYPCTPGCTCPPVGSPESMAGVCAETYNCQPGCVPCPGCAAGRCEDYAGNCDKRRSCKTAIRYGQCNTTQHPCLSNVYCRVVSCVNPSAIPWFNCGASTRSDPRTTEHSAPGLVMPSWEGAAKVWDDQFDVSPAVAQLRGSLGRTDVFVRAFDGNLYWTKQDDAFGPWAYWVGLGAPSAGFQGSPTAVSRSPGLLDVFVRGGDNRLWRLQSYNGGQTWGSWAKPLGDDGTLSSNPTAVSWSPSRVNVYVVGTDNQVYERFWENEVPNGAWLPRGKPSVGIVGHVGAATWGVGRIDVFARGGDNRLWQTYLQPNGQWSSWGRPVGDDGTLTSAPEAASWEANHLAVFVRGTDGGVWWLNNDLRRSPYWSTWKRIGNPSDTIQFDPRAGSRGCHRLDVFARGTDNKLYRYRFLS